LLARAKRTLKKIKEIREKPKSEKKNPNKKQLKSACNLKTPANEETNREPKPSVFPSHNIETLQPNITSDVKTKGGGQRSAR